MAPNRMIAVAIAALAPALPQAGADEFLSAANIGPVDCRRYEEFSIEEVLDADDPWARRCRLFVDAGTTDRSIAASDSDRLEAARIYSDYEFGRDVEAIVRARAWLAERPGRNDDSTNGALFTLMRAAKMSGDWALARQAAETLVEFARAEGVASQSLLFREAELASLALPPMRAIGRGTLVDLKLTAKNRALAPVEIAGKSLDALVDTGSELSVISDSLARQLGLEMIEGVQVPFIELFREHYYASLAIAPEIRIGDLRIENARIIVTNPLKTGVNSDFTIGLDLLQAIGRFGFLDHGKSVALGDAAPDVDCLGGKGILFRHNDGIGLSVTLDGNLAPANYDTGFPEASAYEAPLSFYAPSRRIRKFSQGPGKIGRSPLVIGAFREFDFEMAGAPVKDRNVLIFRSQEPDRKLDFPLTVGGSTTRRLEAIVLDFKTMRYAAVKESSPQTEACFAAASERAH